MISLGVVRRVLGPCVSSEINPRYYYAVNSSYVGSGRLDRQMVAFDGVVEDLVCHVSIHINICGFPFGCGWTLKQHNQFETRSICICYGRHERCHVVSREPLSLQSDRVAALWGAQTVVSSWSPLASVLSMPLPIFKLYI